MGRSSGEKTSKGTDTDTTLSLLFLLPKGCIFKFTSHQPCHIMSCHIFEFEVLSFSKDLLLLESTCAIKGSQFKKTVLPESAGASGLRKRVAALLKSNKQLATRSRILLARPFDSWPSSDNGPRIAKPSKKSMVFLKLADFEMFFPATKLPEL